MALFDAPRRHLAFPLTAPATLSAETPDRTGTVDFPAFPEDAEELMTVSFRLSLKRFVALATAIDVGSDIAFGEQSILAWWIWATSMVEICEELALCLSSENPAVVDALSGLFQNNQTIIQSIINGLQSAGFPQPGLPISDSQKEADQLPENVKDGETCLNDQLWGGVLYLVQSANRAITDFFDVLEAASNTLEGMDIAAEQIPLIGNNVAAAAAIADQLMENLSEGYAGAYTEFYEQSVACDLFCIAQDGCSLSIEQIIEKINARLTSPLDIGDALEFLTGIATGTWVGDEIADVMFLLFFQALKFGQKFGDTIGIRPLNILMSLGADQLASDNWSTLCDCGWESTLDFTTSDYGFEQLGTPASGNFGVWTDTVGWESGYGVVGGSAYQMVQIHLTIDSTNITYLEMTFDVVNGTQDTSSTVYYLASEDTVFLNDGTPASDGDDIVRFGSGDDGDATDIQIRVQAGFFAASTADPGGTATLKGMVVRGFSTKPSQLP